MNMGVLNSMVRIVPEILAQAWGLELQNVEVVSGGAAWADHAAVRLFLSSQNACVGGGAGGGGDKKGEKAVGGHNAKACGLVLYVPAPLAATSTQAGYPGCVEGKGRFDVGRVFNYYHRQFAGNIHKKEGAKKVNGNATLDELRHAEVLGATIDSRKSGFSARNTAIAQNCDFLIAFTWYDDLDAPRSGGGYDTWSKCVGVKLHVPLQKLMDGTFAVPVRRLLFAEPPLNLETKSLMQLELTPPKQSISQKLSAAPNRSIVPTASVAPKPSVAPTPLPPTPKLLAPTPRTIPTNTGINKVLPIDAKAQTKPKGSGVSLKRPGSAASNVLERSMKQKLL